MQPRQSHQQPLCGSSSSSSSNSSSSIAFIKVSISNSIAIQHHDFHHDQTTICDDYVEKTVQVSSITCRGAVATERASTNCSVPAEQNLPTAVLARAECQPTRADFGRLSPRPRTGERRECSYKLVQSFGTLHTLLSAIIVFVMVITATAIAVVILIVIALASQPN